MMAISAKMGTPKRHTRGGMKPVKSIGKRELAHRFLAFLFFVSVVQVFKHFAFRVGDGPEQTIHRAGLKRRQGDDGGIAYCVIVPKLVKRWLNGCGVVRRPPHILRT
jgi:hypothetical protein